MGNTKIIKQNETPPLEAQCKQDPKKSKPITLAEVVAEIKKQQDSIKDAIHSQEDPPILLRKPTIHQGYNTSPYGLGDTPGHYRGATASSASPYSKDEGYNPFGSETSRNQTAPPQIGLTNEEVRIMMEDAKMRSWGLGGNGKHRSLHTQQVYDVVRFTTASFAMNQIIYRLALS